MFLAGLSPVISTIIGIVLIILSICVFVVSVLRTPENLRGWYGKMFAILAVLGIIGGILLIF